MRYLFLFACFLNGSYANLHAQSNPADFIRDIFRTMQRNDTVGFISHYLTAREQLFMLNRFLSNDTAMWKLDPQDEDRSREERGKMFDYAFKGISDLSDAVWIDYKYQVVKEPQVILPSMKGAFFFRIKNDCYMFPIREAVWLDDKWKLSAFDRITKIDSAKVCHRPLDISAFGSFKFEVEVKIIDDSLIVPPPPPPPPPAEPPRRKRKRP